MNALEAKIHRMIQQDGPISVALYMALCLGDAEHGYYMQREAFGRKGDFITAPDVSQLFGEMIGVFMAVCLSVNAQNQPVTLVELGPGRGALMADILRTLKQLRPEKLDGFEVALVETSPRLRGLQAKAIAPYKTPVFYDDIAALPGEMPLLIIGNEFLDALPLRQYQKVGAHWRERMVGVKNSATLGPAELPSGAASQDEGTIFEIAPARTAAILHLAARLKSQGGAALLIDYGHENTGFGDTFQAMRAQKHVPVLQRPGEVDLTSHVDFEVLAREAAAAGCVAALKTQGEFLLELGLLQRAGALGSGKSPDVRSAIEVAVNRLAGLDQMGNLFKVLCVAPSKPLPPPFGNGNQSL
jgi:SAM-dependent MidA family methyltransferase